jgi:SNF2 family DNA or RNA helicase
MVSHSLILDYSATDKTVEGHLIRNSESQVSIAVRALHGHFKWILSGTPLLK